MASLDSKVLLFFVCWSIAFLAFAIWMAIEAFSTNDVASLALQLTCAIGQSVLLCFYTRQYVKQKRVTSLQLKGES
jgi:membrane protein implicated in regulation of membrane protease activity